jgi:hypothetical protein
MASWVRSLIVVAVGLVAWLATTPAFAAAPLCDDRGAIMLAPPPILDAPSASVDVGEPFDCMDQHAFDARYDEGGRSNDPTPAPRHFQAILTSNVGLPGPDVVPAVFSYVAPSDRPGVRGRVERPPRRT